MIETSNFCGLEGKSYRFERVGAETDWAKIAGVILFAAADGLSWRIIRVAEQGGVSGDIAAFWRWRDARRYGATAVFVRRDVDIQNRRLVAADLTAGLQPVCADVEMPIAA